jgi:hypothetical protein
MQPAPAGPFSCVCQLPGTRVAVDLKFDFVDRVGSAAVEAPPGPGRQSEIGGLLLGRTRRDNGLTIIEIEDFEPIESEHAFGPSYLLSPTDRELLERQLGTRRPKSAWSVVGFYRSDTRKHFAVTPEDVALLSCYFRDSSHVVLLIHTVGDAPLTGGFVTWEGRSSGSPRPLVEIPFTRAALTERARVHRAPIAAVTPAVAPAPMPAVTRALAPAPMPAVTRALPPAPMVKKVSKPLVIRVRVRAPGLIKAVRMVVRPIQRHPRLRTGLVWVACAAFLMVAVASAVFRTPQLPGLDVDSVAALRPNSSASIPKPQRQPVAQAEAPRPSAPQPQAEIVRSLPEAPQPQPEAAPPQPPAPEPVSAEVARVLPRSFSVPTRRKPFIRVRHGAADRLATAHIRQTARVRLPARAVTPAVFSPVRLVQPAAPALLMELPEVAAAPAFSELLPRIGDMLKLPAPSAPDRCVNVQVAAYGRSGRAGILRVLPLARKHDKRAGFVAPEPLREDTPAISPELRGRLTREVPIDVKLFVDPAGKVGYAELLSDGTGQNVELATLAVFSSRRWRFSPASLDGAPVPAEVILRFRFGPDIH